MRATCWLVMGAAFELLACGGALVPSDGGTADDQGSPDVEGGDGSTTTQTGYCLYETCEGLSLCGVGKTCPVGDGCNTCNCAATGDGTTASTCTRSGCTCP